MRLLLVEDDKALSNILSKRLTEEGFTLDVCYDGDSAYDYASTLTYDAIILDIMLPKKDGLDVLRYLRQGGYKTPILLLTAKDTVLDRVTGLNAGADDYLVKPFAFEELLARIRTILRRQSDHKDNMLTLSDLTLNLNERSVERKGNRIDLTAKEFSLLEYLLHNQGRVLTRSQICDHVWNNEFAYDSNIVDVYIRYLRNKIDKPYEVKLIHTIRGTGYVARLP